MDRGDFWLSGRLLRLPRFGSRRRTLSRPTLQNKCYDPNDLTLRFVDREDELDFLCEGFPSLRALMSCGHSVTPTSLTNWCRRQLEEGKSRFRCAQYDCKAEWSMEEVCKMALLTPEEKSNFQKTLASNASVSRRNASDSRPCPDCKSPVVRQSKTDLCVCCQVCTAKKGRVYEFCWQCLREWRGPKPRSDRCDNDKCCNPALETLKSCPTITVASVVCPSVRACPTCGSLLEHNGKGCNETTCPKCEAEFCYLCLKMSEECEITCDFNDTYSCCVAPRQTSIPVWI